MSFKNYTVQLIYLTTELIVLILIMYELSFLNSQLLNIYAYILLILGFFDARNYLKTKQNEDNILN